jgi:tRNA pseudouridine55 synthase
VVARARRVYRVRAVGHTGTLDPFATGLLVLLFGRATRLARFVEQQPKTYLATARLGQRTTTDDLTGEALPAEDQAAGPPGRQDVEAALGARLGPQRQRPPAYSAKRVGGERSYRLARRGTVVTLAETEIVVHALELVGYVYPDLTFRCTVSPGAYVRALARDLGDALGVGAHLTALRREAIGSLRVSAAVPLERLTPDVPLQPVVMVLGHLGVAEVTEEEAGALAHGRTVPRVTEPAIRPYGEVVATRGAEVVAICEARDGGLHPRVVLREA